MVDEMAAQMAPDAALDYAKWGNTNDLPWEQQLHQLRNEYFSRRRIFLYGLVGDMDLNSKVDYDDLDDFVLELMNPGAYEAHYGIPASWRGNTDFSKFRPELNTFVNDLDLDFDDIARFASLVRGSPQPADVYYALSGDMDFNRKADFDDVDDFVLALNDPLAYQAKYGVPPTLRGDFNFDQRFDSDDIIGFSNRMRGALARAQLPNAQLAAPEIRFGEMDFQPVSGIQDEEYITLMNPNAVAVDISGWQLTSGVQHTFAPGVVIPAGGTLYVSPNVNAFRARTTGPSGGQGLFVEGNYSGHISSAGETLELVTRDGTVVASVNTPVMPSPAQQYLRISEIMYHPPDPPAGGSYEDDDFEFIEVVNTSADVTLDLEDVAFTQGIEFFFPAMSLAPGEHVVVVHNQVAFQERYGTSIRIAGEYGATPDDFKLSNGGEELRLVDPQGELVHEFSYDDAWYPATDGGGRSLEIVDPVGTALDQWGFQQSWQASNEPGGTPGAARAGEAQMARTADWSTLADEALGEVTRWLS
jgi:hypothetical protein